MESKTSSNWEQSSSSRLHLELTKDMHWLLARLAHAAGQLKENATTEKAGLTSREYTILLSLAKEPARNQQALARTLRIDKSTLVKELDNLGQRNLLTREVPESDRRPHSIRLTEAGRELLNDVYPGVRQVEVNFLQNLSSREQTTLFTLLETLVDSSPVEKIDRGSCI